MSCSEHEIDISVVSSPEASPTNCGQESRDSSLRSQSPTIRLSSAKANGVPSSLNYGKFSLIDSRPTKNDASKHTVCSSSAVLHHTLQTHLNSLNAGLHNTFNNLAYVPQTHPQHSVIPTAGLHGSVLHNEGLCKPTTAAVDCTSVISQNSSPPTEEYKTYLDGDTGNSDNQAQAHNGDLDTPTTPKSAAEMCNLNQKATTGNGFTSFSISSILNRAEPARKNSIHALPSNSSPAAQLPAAQLGAGGAQHDAAMLSR